MESAESDPGKRDPSLRDPGGPDPHLTDRDAFSKTFETLFVPLARYARRLTGDEALACDVVQDVFLKLWEKRRSIRIEVSLRAMLYTMVRNRSLNLTRQIGRIDRDRAPENMEVSQANEVDFEAGELTRRLRGWIDELPERRREAFMLSRYHELTHAEIARIMGLSERTVDTHILLALRWLRERMDRLQHEDTVT